MLDPFLLFIPSLCLDFILQNHNFSYYISMRFFRFGDCISYYVSGVQRTDSGVHNVIHYPKDSYLPQKHWNFPLFHLAILLLKIQNWRGVIKVFQQPKCKRLQVLLKGRRDSTRILHKMNKSPFSFSWDDCDLICWRYLVILH